MICKCPNCSAALEYSITAVAMKCRFCGSVFDASADDTEKLQAEQKMLEYNIYSCSACGAEMIVNGVEASTFCSFCGQPTIVFDRVSKEMAPEYIIPFYIRQDQVEVIVRENLINGKLVPNKIKNFEVDSIRGIYVPFWLFDIHYYDYLYLKGMYISENQKSRETRYYTREGEADFKYLTVDALSRLDDEISQRLEPYYMQELKEFNVNYMSGFYAERFDVTRENVSMLAMSKAKKLFDDEIKCSVDATMIDIVESHPNTKVTGIHYAFLPVWFLTYRDKNKANTILVNGQSGKIVGVPSIDKGKCAKEAFVISLNTVIFSVLVVFGTLLGCGEIYLVFAVVIFILGLIVFIFSLTVLFKAIRKVCNTRKREMVTLIKDYPKEV